MKPTPNRKAGRKKNELPKPKIGYTNPSQLSYIADSETTGGGLIFGEPSEDVFEFPVLVIPCASKSSAQRLRRFLALEEGAKVEAVAKELWHIGNPTCNWHSFGLPWQDRYRKQSARLLTTMGLINGGKG